MCFCSGCVSPVLPSPSLCVTATVPGQVHSQAVQGTETVDAARLPSSSAGVFTFVCRQAEEPVPAETAHPARDAPQHRAHPGLLEAQGRQGVWPPRGGLGVGVREGKEGVRSGCTAPSRADVREEPVPSTPPCPAEAEEEAVYEEPPEQETLYEEPPMVGSLQQGVAGKGPVPRNTLLTHASHGMPDFPTACYL